MRSHRLGQGLLVSAFGIGCQVMCGENYGPADEDEGIATIRRALDLGVNFFDTSETYGHDRANEKLVGRAIKGRRHEAVVCTKFGMQHQPNSDRYGVNSHPDIVAPSCDGSLRALGVDHIDLYYQHRVDPSIPIEETWGALAQLVIAGKVRHLGMSEPGPATLRRAHAVHPVTAVQNEYSLFSRDPEDGMLATIRELGIGLVSFAPLGRGFLTGAFRSIDDFAEDDFRRHLPRFQGQNLSKNLELVDRLAGLAAERGATPIQLALAWLLAQGPDIVPIPGTESRDKLESNAVAAEIELTAEELAAIDEIIPRGAFGARLLPSDFTAGVETVALAPPDEPVL